MSATKENCAFALDIYSLLRDKKEAGNQIACVSLI